MQWNWVGVAALGVVILGLVAGAAFGAPDTVTAVIGGIAVGLFGPRPVELKK